MNQVQDNLIRGNTFQVLNIYTVLLLHCELFICHDLTCFIVSACNEFSAFRFSLDLLSWESWDEYDGLVLE